MSAGGLKTLVVGCRGMLGADLVRTLGTNPDYGPIECADLPEINICDPDNLREFFEDQQFDVIFNCAAYTDVDGCETHRDAAFDVNGNGVGYLAEIAASQNARLVHVSTDYVFDGSSEEPYTEEDEPRPLNAYGESKLEGERQIRASNARWLMLRTAWLYGSEGRNFVDQVMRLARDKDELSGVTDQVGSPTWTLELSHTLAAVGKTDAEGIFHAVNEGACSRFEQMQWIVKCGGFNTRINPVTSEAFPRPARIPPTVQLSTDKLKRELGIEMRPWREALCDYVAARMESAPRIA